MLSSSGDLPRSTATRVDYSSALIGSHLILASTGKGRGLTCRAVDVPSRAVALVDQLVGVGHGDADVGFADQLRHLVRHKRGPFEVERLGRTLGHAHLNHENQW